MASGHTRFAHSATVPLSSSHTGTAPPPARLLGQDTRAVLLSAATLRSVDTQARPAPPLLYRTFSRKSSDGTLCSPIHGDTVVVLSSQGKRH